VQLIVETDNLCRDTLVRNVRIYAKPLSAFTFNDVCVGTTATFVNNSSIAPTDTILSFVWDFGNGTGGPQAFSNVSCLYNQPGNYDVKLLSISTQNCVDSLVQQLTVYDAPVVSFLSNNVCIYDSASFFNNTQNPVYGSIGGWSWDFGDNSANDTSNWNTSHYYNQPGIYDVSLTVYNAVLNCSDTFNTSVEIYPPPLAEFSALNACLNDAVVFTDMSQGTINTYVWHFGDGNSVTNQQNTQHIYDTAALYNVWLIITTDMGCVDSVRHDVITYPLPFADFGFTNVCFGNSTSFTDMSSVLPPDQIMSWQWNFGDGSTVQQNQNPLHLYPQSGSYTVQLFVSTLFNCVDSIDKTITVHPLAVVDFMADTVGCTLFCPSFTDLTMLASGQVVQWLWNFGDGNNALVQNPSNCYENNTFNPQTYSISLTVMTDASCVSSLSKPDYITVLPKPLADFTLHPEKTNLLEPLISFYDQSQQAISWLWHFGDNASDSSQNPVHAYQDTGSFLVELIVQNIYNCYDTANGIVYIEPDWALYIPNGFTPNNDGLNDYFFTQGYGITAFEIFIFSRWGQMVFYADDMQTTWDGRVMGKKSNEIAMQGVYAYKINFTTVTHRKYTRYGHVTLLGAEGY